MSQPTNVNEAFTASRDQLRANIENAPARIAAENEDRRADLAAKLASGYYRPLGDGRYEITEGFEKGEVWTYREAANGAVQVMPEHNLDTNAAGEVSLYTRTPAWHRFGNVIPEGLTAIDDVLKAGGIDWLVSKEPSRYLWNGELRIQDGKFTTVRDDTGDALGTVGNIYTPFQQRDAFEFAAELVNADRWETPMVWESAGALYGGKRVFLCLELPGEVTIDEAGIADKVRRFVCVMNSHDGTTPITVVTTPWRPICGNTERFAVRDAWTTWKTRHTTNAPSRVTEARRTLGLSAKYFDAWAIEENQLAATDMAIDEFRKVANELFPQEKDSKPATTRHTKLMEDLVGRFTTNAEKLGFTGYAAERAITEYLDHGKAIKQTKNTLRGDIASSRAAMALDFGNDNDKKKTAAHERLMLARR